MSLLHRASSTDSLSRLAYTSASTPPDAEDQEQAQVIQSERRLSYNPIGNGIVKGGKGVEQEEDLGAHEVSSKKRLAQVAVAVVYCLLAAGVVFGYAALKPVLIAEEVYRDRCTLEEAENHVRVCYGQELRLNLLFTLAAVVTNIAALPIGTILDRYGPRVASIIGSCFLALGAIFLASASPKVDLYIPGYLCLALGGPFIFISSFQLSNAFPTRSGLILALLTGAFDTSSAVFLMYRLIYEATDGAATLRIFFLAYLIVPVGIVVAQILLMPGQSYKSAGALLDQASKAATESQSPDTNHYTPDQQNSTSDQVNGDGANSPLSTHTTNPTVTEITSLLGTDKIHPSPSPPKPHPTAVNSTSAIEGVLHHLPAHRQLLTPWFLLLALFTMLQMLRINLFVATIRPQYEWLFDSYRQARALNSFFDIALPLGGIIGIPFIGALLDSFSTVSVLLVLVLGGLLVGTLGVIPDSKVAAYIGIVLFVLYRPLYYTAVSDYSAKVFGFRTFGKVYGLVICAAGLFNLLQTVLDRVMQGVFDGDPRIVNGVLMAATALVGILLIGWVWVNQRRRLKVLRGEVEDHEGGEEGGEEERERLLGSS